MVGEGDGGEGGEGSARETREEGRHGTDGLGRGGAESSYSPCHAERFCRCRVPTHFNLHG